ncbi:DNA/RNA non-specific endonuclease [Methylococcus mesophilus]|uniref:DNA/RNA non-specific endonuclease n=1 Tax=Methylococcus mesophilus TaxID=2993564 RepID=UPI00224B7375|nr:DNA/RNA non-specific endonuclease [Methylococcus mesophilus]UZR29051.1 DNA/RNA non-specific endonuclease [Methylococcus mesophilus]
MPVRSTLVAVVFALSLHFQPVQAADDALYRRDYEGFTVWLDCTQHGAIRFRYNAQHDTGSFDRANTFKLDPDVPAECQQASAKSYKLDDPTVPNYERGHLVPANHLDYSQVAIQQSNYMTNILPQTATFNRGAWLATEEMTCSPI